MTFDDWWKEYSIDLTSKYECLYDFVHSAYTFGLETMLERKKEEIDKLKEYKYMYEELCK